MNPTLKLQTDREDLAQGLFLQLQALQEKCKSLSTTGIDALGYAAEIHCALGVHVPPASVGKSQWLEERRSHQRHNIVPVNGRRSHYISVGYLGHGSDQHSPVTQM